MLDKLGEIFGLDSLERDHAEITSLKMKEGGQVLHFWLKKHLLYAHMIDFPKEQTLVMCQLCLQLTGPQILSCKPDEHALYMHRVLHPEMTKLQLEVVVADFLNALGMEKKHAEIILRRPPKKPLIDGPSGDLGQIFQ